MPCFFYQMPFGKILLEEQNSRLTKLVFTPTAYFEDIQETPLLREACFQLNAYFEKKLQVFDIPYDFHGTLFQKKVWHALEKIPFGTTKSYKEIAVMSDSPKACRAVGNANNKNPLPIFIPCHRVIGANGKLVGYAGGLSLKQTLLEIEATK